MRPRLPATRPPLCVCDTEPFSRHSLPGTAPDDIVVDLVNGDPLLSWSLCGHVRGLYTTLCVLSQPQPAARNRPVNDRQVTAVHLSPTYLSHLVSGVFPGTHTNVPNLPLPLTLSHTNGYTHIPWQVGACQAAPCSHLLSGSTPSCVLSLFQQWSIDAVSTEEPV